MEDSLLGVLLVTLIFIGLLLFVLPEALRLVARRNLRQRHRLVNEVRRLEDDSRTLLRQLAPYLALQAPQYRQSAQAARQLLQEAAAHRRAMAMPGRLTFPRLPDAGWAAPHFVAHPQDAVTILATYRRLRSYRRVLEGAVGRLATARRDLDQLQQMPARLRQETDALQARLAAVRGSLQAERTAGVAALTGLESRLGRLRQEVDRRQQQLLGPAGPTLAQADEVGQSLDDVSRGLAQLEQEVAAARGERSALDQKRQETDAALETLRGRLEGEGFTAAAPGPLPLLLETVAGLQEAAAQSRRAASYAAALELVRNGAALLDVGHHYLSAWQAIAVLAAEQASLLHPEALAGLQQQLQQAEAVLQERLATRDADPAERPLPATMETALGTLGQRLASLAQEAHGYWQQHQEAERRLAQQARQAATVLTQAWQALQRTLQLADGDPLARRYRTALHRHQAALGRPRQLQLSLAEMQELQLDIEASHSYVQARLQQLGDIVRSFPGLVGQVELAAGEWRCLQAPLQEIKESAAGVQQIWLRVRDTVWLDEAHDLLDELKLLNQRAQATYGQMVQQFRQLDRLVNIVEETIGFVQNVSDDLESNRVQRVLGLVEMQLSQAQEAETAEDALAALRRAETLINQLATG